MAGLIIGTVAIEGAFWQMLNLRKQSAYPHILALALSTVQDLGPACDVALRLTCHYLKCKAAVLTWVDGERLAPAAAYGVPADWRHRLRPPTAEHLPIQTALQQQRAVLGPPSECPCWSGLFADDHRVAYIPLVSLDRVTAVLSVVGARKTADLGDRKLLEALGIVVGLSLDNLRLNHREYQSIMQVLCSALDMRDSATEGHSQRVAHLATLVARQLGLPPEEVKKIEQAAILHDIGKIGVADAVLSKPGALTEEEWTEMRRHPQLGFAILEDIDSLREPASIVYAHHERHDGSGYPRGLKGEQIPIGARIFAVVDSYDAMTTHRPYRRARPHPEAIEEIMRHSGSQFDPAAVRAFLELDSEGLVRPHHLPDPEESALTVGS